MRQLALAIAAALAAMMVPRAAVALQEDIMVSFERLNREALKAGLAGDLPAAAGAADSLVPPDGGDMADSLALPDVPPFADSEVDRFVADPMAGVPEEGAAGASDPGLVSLAAAAASDPVLAPPADPAAESAAVAAAPTPPGAATAAEAASAGAAAAEGDDPNANSTDPHQHRLREVARARAKKLKERSMDQRWAAASVGGIEHVPVALVIIALLCTMAALSVYVIGPAAVRELLGLEPPSKMPGANHQPQPRAYHGYTGQVIRRGISPVRSSLAPPWPHRPQRNRRITFDPTIHGLPSMDSLVGTLNAAAPLAEAPQAVFPPPHRWRDGSPVRGLDGPSVDVFVAPNMSEAQRQHGFNSSDAESAGAGLNMGAFGGTWGRLGPANAPRARQTAA